MVFRRHLTIVNRKVCCSIYATNFPLINWPPMNWPSTASKCTPCSLFFSCVIHTRLLYCRCVHHREVSFDEGTKKSVHCSELGGVHLAEVYLQQKSIGGTETSVQTGGVHYREMFINIGFTVYVFIVLYIIISILFNIISSVTYSGIWRCNHIFRVRRDGIFKFRDRHWRADDFRSWCISASEHGIQMKLVKDDKGPIWWLFIETFLWLKFAKKK